MAVSTLVGNIGRTPKRRNPLNSGRDGEGKLLSKTLTKHVIPFEEATLRTCIKATISHFSDIEQLGFAISAFGLNLWIKVNFKADTPVYGEIGSLKDALEQIFKMPIEILVDIFPADEMPNGYTELQF